MTAANRTNVAADRPGALRVQSRNVWLNAGAAGAVLFLGVSTVEIFARPGFDISRHAISMLSLGERGWLMIATFILSGLLAIICAAAMRGVLAGRRGATWGPVLVGLFGLGQVLAGIFAAPPGMGFPPGTPADLAPVMDTGAIVHSIGFMLAFGSLIAACFVFARIFSGKPAWAVYCAATGVAIPALIALGMSGVVAPGIAFYVAAVLAWLFVAAAGLRLSAVSRA